MSEEIHETPSTTPNFQTELAAQLAELMPEVIADGKVDVEKLKELLDGDTADTGDGDHRHRSSPTSSHSGHICHSRNSRTSVQHRGTRPIPSR